MDRRTNSPVVLAETWTLALEALRANKLRAMLTMLGVIIGSACIVLVVTVALAGKRYIISQIEAVGSNLVYGEVIHPGGGQPSRMADEISLADLAAVKEGVPHVVQVAGTREIVQSVVAQNAIHPIAMVGVTQGFQQIRNLVILRGRYFDEDDMASHAKVCLLTPFLSATLFPGEDPVGHPIRLEEMTLTVIGVYRERVSTFGQSEITGESILVPFSLIGYYTGQEYVKTFYAQADRPEDVDAVTREVHDLLISRHRPGVEYHVTNLASILETAKRISLAMTIVLILIAMIALAISGIGIMNIMLVTVTERTREIGIRKAVGAPRGAILYQFLFEAVMISGTGAITGIAIAVAIPFLVEALLRFFPIPTEVHIPISWLSVIIAFLVSCSTGLLFGYLPASKAAQLQPTDSLRYE
ncbi:MAG TPA: ABC transporter permease [Candidatus Acidoferrales bacterium]|nr:ABC transporter permease [Candidatus Acidoferrales bacterium]